MERWLHNSGGDDSGGVGLVVEALLRFLVSDIDTIKFSEFSSTDKCTIGFKVFRKIFVFKVLRSLLKSL